MFWTYVHVIEPSLYLWPPHSSYDSYYPYNLMILMILSFQANVYFQVNAYVYVSKIMYLSLIIPCSCLWVLNILLNLWVYNSQFVSCIEPTLLILILVIWFSSFSVDDMIPWTILKFIDVHVKYVSFQVWIQVCKFKYVWSNHICMYDPLPFLPRMYIFV